MKRLFTQEILVVLLFVYILLNFDNEEFKRNQSNFDNSLQGYYFFDDITEKSEEETEELTEIYRQFASETNSTLVFIMILVLMMVHFTITIHHLTFYLN